MRIADATTFESTLDFAKEQDRLDPLSRFRGKFHLPTDASGKPLIYFCGNSLGLQPKQTEAYIQQELNDWANLGVEGHVDATNPWMPYHESLSAQMAKIVGAKSHEVVIMNTLTVNLHLMMVSFYRPTKKRYKIIVETDAFPSDKYAVRSQIKHHGFDPDAGLIEWKPRPGEQLCRLEDLEALMQTHGKEIALVMVGNTNYYSGQYYPIDQITTLGHEHGAKVGIDLAHGVGNIQPNLHENGPDFAVWCTYKYLNSGPGSLGGCFVHERHANNKDINRFTGWWGHNKQTRFNMRHEFDPIPGAEGWQLSNPPILSMAAIKASLAIFEEAGMDNLREKSIKLTGFLEFLIDSLKDDRISIITPRNPELRGCQLSITVREATKDFHQKLTDAGIISDWREPDVIRVAPTPLYNTFEEVFEFVTRLKRILN
ncbi:kynureninase [Gangjinia marincola]|uniref:Kynureninase n=1 Tax=Gangjinia marincola TaxID=578463 RepID=A0ABN1MJZ9_9FLAO